MTIDAASEELSRNASLGWGEHEQEEELREKLQGALEIESHNDELVATARNYEVVKGSLEVAR